MFNKQELEEIEKRKKQWEEVTLNGVLKRFGITESPSKFCTPLNVKDHDFLEKVGFPGEFPYTAGVYPVNPPMDIIAPGGMGTSGGLVRAGQYSGYGTVEDTRDFYKAMQDRGWTGGPNIAFDLPTQCGYDSDNPAVQGEVGKVGVAVDTLQDFEVVYEAFTNSRDLDKIASNWTINPTANIILAMYIALAQKRGIPLDKLRGTPQNDILKEILSRGTQVFPVRPSMRMTRDTIVYCTKNMPKMNTVSMSGYHMREAGASLAQSLAFNLCDAIAYVQLGIDAGLDVDSFAPRMTFLGFGGSLEMLKEIALQRAARRMWARIMKERFGAKKPRSYLMRFSFASSGNISTTAQRPLNNLTRSVVGGIASALSGGIPYVFPPYDEPLGLGWSLEAQQLCEDANRILHHETDLCGVIDPFAGSYYMEALTDQIEEEAWEIIKKVDDLGGVIEAIERGWMQNEIAKSAYEYQHQVETGQKVVVGVNRYTGENELEVTTARLVPDPYDPEKRAEAEEKQIVKLTKVKKERDNQEVEATLKRLKDAAKDESVNLIPPILEAVKAYASVGEMCDTLRDVFGEYREYVNI